MINIEKCSITGGELRIAVEVQGACLDQAAFVVGVVGACGGVAQAVAGLGIVGVSIEADKAWVEIRMLYSELTLPVSAISLFVKGEWHVFLDKLFPQDDSEFERTFIRSIQRTGFPELDFFVSYQIARFYLGSDSYYCGAQVVRAYKAVEINDRRVLLDTDEGFEQAYGRVESCDVDWHPRRNREHLKVSLLCAHWHIKLALFDEIGFRRVLEEVVSSLPGISNFYTPAYPVNLSLLIYTIYLKAIGEDENSKRVALSAADVFKRAADDADPSRLTLFGELAVPHKAALYALQISLAPYPLMEADLKTKVLAAFRVKGRAADNLFSLFARLSGMGGRPTDGGAPACR